MKTEIPEKAKLSLHDMCHMVFSKDFPTLLSPSKTEGRQ